MNLMLKDMPDISKCNGIDCPLKNNCYRYIAIASEYQAYFMHPPYDEEKNECKYFWDNNLKESNDNKRV